MQSEVSVMKNIHLRPRIEFCGQKNGTNSQSTRESTRYSFYDKKQRREYIERGRTQFLPLLLQLFFLLALLPDFFQKLIFYMFFSHKKIPIDKRLSHPKTKTCNFTQQYYKLFSSTSTSMYFFTATATGSCLKTRKVLFVI